MCKAWKEQNCGQESQRDPKPRMILLAGTGRNLTIETNPPINQLVKESLKALKAVRQ
jgi:hypothetical protein